MKQEKYDTDSINSQTDIVELVGRYVELKKQGAEYAGLCLFHTESTPSMTVSPQKGFVHCFGCGAHHDPIGFLMAAENIEFTEACKRLLNGSGTALPPVIPHPQIELKKAPPRKTYAPPLGSAGLSPDDMAIKSIGAPTSIHPYISATGDTLGWAAYYPDNKPPRYWTFGKRSTSDVAKWERLPFT